MIPTRRGPLRVAMVSAIAFPLMGGIATHVHEVSTRLGAAGVDVTVLTTDLSGDLPVEEKLPGYRVRRWRAYPRSRDYYLAPDWRGTCCGPTTTTSSMYRGCTTWSPRPRWQRRGEPASRPC